MSGIRGFDDELILIFIEETRELLETMEQGLLHLEQSPDAETLHAIFRAAHTIKGSAAALGHQRMSRLAHSMENLLDEIRSGRRAPDGNLTSLLLRGVDQLRAYLHGVEHRDLEGEPCDDLIAELERFVGQSGASPRSGAALAGQAAGSAPHPSPESREEGLSRTRGDDDPDDALFSRWLTAHAAAIEAEQAQGRTPYRLQVRVAPGAVMGDVRLVQILIRCMQLGTVLASQPTEEQLMATEGAERLLVLMTTGAAEPELRDAVSAIPDISLVRLEPVAVKPAAKSPASEAESSAEAVAPGDAGSRASPTPQAEPASAIEGAPGQAGGAVASSRAAGGQAAAGGRMVKVNVTLLSELMNVVGELVTARTQLEQVVRDLREVPGAERVMQSAHRCALQIGRLVDQLQDITMQTRLQSMSETFAKIRRLVRDTARALDKRVDLTIEGEDIRVDRDIVSHIGEPLMHLVRNALDHGIETPGDRAVQGKPPAGQLRIRAEQAGGEIILRVSDDGRGIDPQRVRDKALRQGLIAAEEAARLSEREIYQLLFRPGFSTAEKVTDVSGRGVGLDVVKRSVERLRGTVSVQSEPGKGTVFAIRLPTTLAIQEVLLTRIRRTIYAVPVTSIQEISRIQPNTIHRVPGGRLLRTKTVTCPLLDPADLVPPNGGALASMQVLLCRTGAGVVALAVEQVLRSQKIVVKPLTGSIGHVPGVVGAAILGDGSVALVLDPDLLVSAHQSGRLVRL